MNLYPVNTFVLKRVCNCWPPLFFDFHDTSGQVSDDGASGLSFQKSSSFTGKYLFKALLEFLEALRCHSSPQSPCVANTIQQLQKILPEYRKLPVQGRFLSIPARLTSTTHLQTAPQLPSDSTPWNRLTALDAISPKSLHSVCFPRTRANTDLGTYHPPRLDASRPTLHHPVKTISTTLRIMPLPRIL